MQFRFGDCELDEELFELRHRGQKIAVQPKVLTLLFFLVRQRARAVTRNELLAGVWSDVKVGNASLSRAVVEARRAIGDEAQEVIVTVRGHGFRFAAPVTEVAAGAKAQPALSPTFVGRDACVAALTARLDQALIGRGAIVWISGEGGIGKTRLAEEFATLARSRGAHVFVARCHESPPPPRFWPWTQLLKSLAADLPETARQAAKDAQAKLAEANADSDFAVFEEVTRAFAANDEFPVVLLLDDVHWADDGSLQLLRFFARETRDSRVLVVCAYRDTALSEERSKALGSLLREYGSLSIPLRGLSREDTARLVTVLKGREPSVQFASALYERTGGCPIFVHQVLETEWAARALADHAKSIASSIDLQNGLIESIGRHLDGVSASCRDVLVCAAVMGKDIEFAPLATATGLDHQTLLDRLDEAARSRLVQKTKEGRYRFVHPLIGDVLYKQLSASDRAARHRAVGEALLVFYRGALDVHATQLAHHFFRAAPAGTAREAFDWSVRAARHAIACGDARGAIKQWQQALQSLDLLAGVDDARLDAALGLARAKALAEDEGAGDAYLDAAMLARALGRPEALADAALEFAGLARKDDPRRRALVGEARTALESFDGDRASELVDRLAAAEK